MSVADFLLDARAAHAARTSYRKAAERHAENALLRLDVGDAVAARYLARLAGLCDRSSHAEYGTRRR